jgi:hypothetical protein
MAKQKKETKALAKKDGNGMIVLEGMEFILANMSPDRIMESIAENFEDEELGPNDLDRVRVPSGGQLLWLVPDLEEGEIALKTIEGVMVMYRTTRAYWESTMEDSGGGSPPDCSSQEGKIGIGNPGGNCNKCPLNQFGTGRGERGKACKEMRLIFVLRPQNLLPLVMVLPPTSIQPFKKYLQRLANNGIGYKKVVTTVGLKESQNKDNIKFAQASFGVADDKGGKKLFLDDASAAHIAEYAASLRKAFEAVQFDVAQEEVQDEQE